MAEADGNRTRPPGIARRTGFEDREGHQPPFASLPLVSGEWEDTALTHPAWSPAQSTVTVGLGGRKVGNTYKQTIESTARLTRRIYSGHLADGSDTYHKQGFATST